MIEGLAAPAVLHPADELGDGHLCREPGVFLAGNRQVSRPGRVFPQVPCRGGEGLGVAGAASGHDARRRPRPRAAQLHFLHGRNPLCQVYLTNMGPKGANAGAGKSIMRPFHTWFAEKSPWSGPDSLGPAPGLLVGGPNSAIGDAGRLHGSLRPLTNRPRRPSRTGPRRGTRPIRRTRIRGPLPNRQYITRPVTYSCSHSSWGGRNLRSVPRCGKIADSMPVGWDQIRGTRLRVVGRRAQAHHRRLESTSWWACACYAVWSPYS